MGNKFLIDKIREYEKCCKSPYGAEEDNPSYLSLIHRIMVFESDQIRDKEEKFKHIELEFHKSSNLIMMMYHNYSLLEQRVRELEEQKKCGLLRNRDFIVTSLMIIIGLTLVCIGVGIKFYPFAKVGFIAVAIGSWDLIIRRYMLRDK